ncbi:hypothetical protein OIO90_005216 [Microbotryomycetes sp. JL221]|nr:hypothetical protein OIO90_005216 [Microbotryomycetes sp. JL221]
MSDFFKTPAVPSSSSTGGTKRKLVEPQFDVNSYKSIKLGHDDNNPTRVTIQDVRDDDDDEVDAQTNARDFAPGGDADYFEEEDQDGRFFGGGLSTVQKQVLNLMDGDDPEHTNGESSTTLQEPTELTPSTVKKQVLTFEKSIDENRKLRTKFSEDPTKFVDSEFNLIQSIQGLMLFSTQPTLTFPILIDVNATESLTDLLSHENPDVVMAVIEVLEEWLDPESFDDVDEDQDDDQDVQIEQEKKLEAIKSLVDKLRQGGLVDLVVSTLDRLNEFDETERIGVFHTMGLIENLVTLDNSIATLLLQPTSNFLPYLIKRLSFNPTTATRPPKTEINEATERINSTDFDQNKFYAGEMLSLVLSLPLDEDVLNKVKTMIAQQGYVDVLLKVLSMYRKRDPKDADELEYMENVFDSICACLTSSQVKQAFQEGEGVELMCLLLKGISNRDQNNSNKTMTGLAKTRAIKCLDYALQGTSGIQLCERFVEALGLKMLFALFMGKGLSSTKKQKDNLTPTDLEHLLSIISSLFTSLSSDSTLRLRLLTKFIEQSYSKIDRLIELRFQFEIKIEKQMKQQFETLVLNELDQDELYLERLDKGLFSLQLCDYILAWICMEDDGARDHVKMLLSRQDKSLLDIVQILNEYKNNINVGEEIEQEDNKQLQLDEDELIRLNDARERRDILNHLLEYLKSVV